MRSARLSGQGRSAREHRRGTPRPCWGPHSPTPRAQSANGNSKRREGHGPSGCPPAASGRAPLGGPAHSAPLKVRSSCRSAFPRSGCGGLGRTGPAPDVAPPRTTQRRVSTPRAPRTYRGVFSSGSPCCYELFPAKGTTPPAVALASRPASLRGLRPRSAAGVAERASFRVQVPTSVLNGPDLP